MSVYSYSGQSQSGQRPPSGNEFQSMENQQPRPFSEPMTGTSPTQMTPPGQYGDPRQAHQNYQNQMDPYMQQNHQNNPHLSQQHRSDPRLGDPNQGGNLQTQHGVRGQSSAMSIHAGPSSTSIAGGQMLPGQMGGQMPPGSMGGQMQPGSMGGQMQIPAVTHTPPSPAASQINMHQYGQNQGNPHGYGQNQTNNGMTQNGMNQNQPGMNPNGMNPNGMNQNQNQNGMNQNGMNQNQNQNVMNQNGMNQNQNQNGMNQNGTNQMQNGMNQGGMNQMQNGNPMNGMNQNGMDQNGRNQSIISGVGQPGRRSFDSQINTNALARLSQATIRRLSADPVLAANITNQIDQMFRSRANSLENNQLNPGNDPNNPIINNLEAMDQFTGQAPQADGVVEGICRMDMNGVSSNNAQLEKMLNSAIATAFQKGYQCKKKELRCCKIKKRRCPPQPCCNPPIPMCAPARPNPCPPGGSPVPGFDIFSQPPRCGAQAPEVRSVSCINPCCRPRPVCRPACPPPPPPPPQQCAPPIPCRKPVDSSKVPTCIMIPFRAPGQTQACPRRARKKCGCRPSEYVQSLLEISAALCDQQCALVKLMSDFRV